MERKENFEFVVLVESVQEGTEAKWGVVGSSGD